MHLLRRTAVLTVAPLLLLGLAAPSAGAAGTGGLEVTPDPAVVDGVTASRFTVDVPSRGEATERFTVRNTTDEPRTARLYTAEVRDVDGTLSVGQEGSSRWAVLPPQEIVLAPGEVRAAAFRVPGGDLPDDQAMAAVVLEVSNGSVSQRAATMVYLEPGRRVPLPLLLVVLAVALIGAGAAAWTQVLRRARGATAG